MKGNKGRKIKQPDKIEYGATSGNMEGYVKGHAHSLEYIKWRWFYAPAYRYTPAVCGSIIPAWGEER